MPVIEHYARLGKVAEVSLLVILNIACSTQYILQINSSGSVEEIHTETCQWVEKVFAEQAKLSK